VRAHGLWATGLYLAVVVMIRRYLVAREPEAGRVVGPTGIEQVAVGRLVVGSRASLHKPRVRIKVLWLRHSAKDPSDVLIVREHRLFTGGRGLRW